MKRTVAPLIEEIDNMRWDVLNRGAQTMLVIAGASMLLAIMMLAWSLLSGMSKNDLETTPTPVPAMVAQPAKPTPTHNRANPLVGIVSGHSGYDPGAVCPDGLTEAEVNRTIALEVIDLLDRKGIETDLLDEFDPRLTGYQADALVSIHADSCDFPGASGFKVARITFSAIPEAEDRLVACLTQSYAAETQLSEHHNTITDGMTNYHAFREIASSTPGAIIETGFLLEDRYLLERKPKLAARGIAAGIICFLDSQ